TLVGPAVYQTDTAKDGAREGTVFIDKPVSNLVRSTAQPGTIRVFTSSPGLEPAEVKLVSLAPTVNRVAGTDPSLTEQGRRRVTRMTAFQACTAVGFPLRNTIAEIDKDFDVAVHTPKQVLENFVKQRNRHLDVSTAAYRAFIDRMTQMVIE